jgi:isopentenyldiphosphate isomerase
MTEEYFDVVNERNEVTGKERRSEIHRLGLKHRAVHVLVFNSRGHVFFQKRSMRKDSPPGLWDSSASGHLDAGEDYDQCVLRECREEIGITLDELPEKLFQIDACEDTGQEFVWVYRCEHEGPFTLQASEIDSGGWFEIGHLDDWIERSPGDFARAFLLVWKMYSESYRS